jgi:hypothetical protein
VKESNVVLSSDARISAGDEGPSMIVRRQTPLCVGTVQAIGGAQAAQLQKYFPSAFHSHRVIQSFLREKFLG